MSKSFYAALTFLFVGTALFFWNEHQRLETRYAEIERQNRVAMRVYHAIERYSKAPSEATDQQALVAMDIASEEKLTENRQMLLADFYRNARRCHVDGRYTGSAVDCRAMSHSRVGALTAAVGEDLDQPTN